MNESEKYILETLRKFVWSGFYTPAQAHGMVDDILEEDADEEMIRAAVHREFAAKLAAESTWPATTDCDRLDLAFEALHAKGVIALHNAGSTMSDGLCDVGEALNLRGHGGVIDYCFYHGQDVDRAVDGGGLLIAFGDLKDNKAERAKIGHVVRQELEAQGLNVSWDGDSETRINLPHIDWKRRTPV